MRGAGGRESVEIVVVCPLASVTGSVETSGFAIAAAGTLYAVRLVAGEDIIVSVWVTQAVEDASKLIDKAEIRAIFIDKE